MRKKSKQSISLIQRKIWEQLRRICRVLYANKDGTIDCYTCGAKNLQGSNCQLGHLFSKATLSAFLKYDLRVLRWQCFFCNINCGGRGADFYKRMLDENGEEFMNQLEKDRQISVKAYDHYVELLDRYNQM